MAAFRTGLMAEIVVMSFDTLRSNKMRSALTVLGVVIGITSIVGMTSLIRGFNDSLAESVRQSGANTIYVQKFELLSFASGKSFVEILKRPNLTIEDARAIARDAPSVGHRGRLARRHGREQPLARVLQEPAHEAAGRLRRDGELRRGQLREARDGPLLRRPARSSTAAQVVVLGDTAYQSLFPNVDPLGKKVRIGANEFTVIGVMDKRPIRRHRPGQDDLVVIPYTTHEKFYGKVNSGSGRVRVNGSVVNESSFRSGMIALVVRPDAHARAGDARGARRSCASATT